MSPTNGDQPNPVEVRLSADRFKELGNKEGHTVTVVPREAGVFLLPQVEDKRTSALVWRGVG